MARRNSLQSLRWWASCSERAPYRASLPASVSWDFDRPDHRQVTAFRVSPGGRLLCAFELAEVRDWFVDGFADLGAQVEPDRAERASARRARPPAPAAREGDLESLFQAVRAADAARRAAEAPIRQAFNEPAEALLAAGDIAGAEAIRASMPDLVERMLLTQKIREACDQTGALPVPAPPAPLDAARATALLDEQRASRAFREAEAAMEAAVWPVARDLAESGDRDGLRDLIGRVPPCVCRAFLVDWERHEAFPDAAPLSNDESPNP
ncbi:hypothetical protein LAZ40_02350 [Cereibacter sphaeroides]|uniref:hypothetical protein n=1 Tax=Cereibacter sphaeroides TaxID=1063 RepID=UPI001F221705|nr:hypothetical protein [Cereibacter sphaeroides]MCE6957899.1 hypothetical protein [Cereibacter sphaeroides]MCE6971753.1 hypothetical protein [Cereibacter sphaeroides]